MTMGNGGRIDWGDDTFMSGSSPRSITLTMRQGPNPGHRFTVTKNNITIGRLPTNDVSIPDQQVSRHHANITWENDRFVIRDLGSANGTAVNGTHLTGPCPLRDGDVIGLGEIVVTFQGFASSSGIGMDSLARSNAPSHGPLPTPTGTMEIDSSPTMIASLGGGWGTIWPILVGIGLAIFLALAFVAVILVFVFSQTKPSPKITIQQPLSGSQAEVGQPVLILASATDRTGVTRVELWVDGILNTNITSDKPGGEKILLVQHPWVPVTGGTRNISLKAYNVSGQASEPVNITIGVTDMNVPTPTPQVAPTATSTPMGQATTSSTSTPLTLPTPTALTCSNDAAFISDVTVPDNTIFQPGARIDKTWRIRNSGTCPWGTGYRLVFVSGNKMGAPDNQPVVPTAPGGTTDVTVTMYAPSSYGVHTGLWRMVNANGESFGGRFTIVIQVPSPHTPTPVVTPTFTPLPGPIININADRDHINAGECTTIHASVEGVKAAWLDGEPIAGGYREEEVCPCEETKYVVDAELPNGDHVTEDVTVHVDGSCVVDKPDLVIRDLQEVDGNTNPDVGETINMRLRIKNQGSVTARDIRTSWRPKGEGGSEIIEHTIDRLDPGEDHNFYWDYIYPTAEEFRTFAKVDYTNNVDESDEDNNTKTLTITVSED